MKRLCGISLAVVGLLTWAGGAEPAAPATPPRATPLPGPAHGGYAQTVQPLLQKYCYECHGPQKHKAQLRYDQFTGYRPEDRHLWSNVHEQLSNGEMPPADRPQPTEAERAAIRGWIEREAAAARKAQGTGSTRRLNRREFSAALRDVTGLSVDYASAMPGDGKVGGFDTAADGLQDAADSVAQAMKITRAAVDGIRFLEPAAASTARSIDMREMDNPRKAFEELYDPDPKRNGGGKIKPGKPPGRGLLLEATWLGDRDALTAHVPPPASGRGGVLRLKLTVSVLKPFPNLPNPRLWVEVGGQDIDYPEVTADAERPQELTYEVQLDDLPAAKRGIAIRLSNKVEVPYTVEGFANDDRTKPEDKVPGGSGLFRPVIDRKLPIDKRPAPVVVVQRIEIDPGYVAPWPPAAWKADVGTIADNPESAKRLLNLWIARAWRQPAGEAEQAPFHALYAKLRGQGMGFEDALRATFQSVLLSSRFRYLSSPSDPASGEHAIASRLSFMLWGAPPDEALKALAAASKLREPAVLDAQVDRLLADRRSDAFVRPFVTQWLEMEQPITLAMEHLKREDHRFGRNLKASMREETIRYVAELLRANRPAGELLNSDWTMMNDILARHYGYDGVEGGHLRKVKLRPDDPRGGGILGHAGIQSMLCWMGENWVIYRGAWALRHVLDDPPPPPPLEVPELVPSAGGNKGKPYRELLRIHQEDPNCAVCHVKMDPLGFAFQNFDLSGRWRDVEYESYARDEIDGKIAWRGVGKTRPADVAGQLPRGEAFTSYAQFKQLLATNYSQDVVRGLMKNLVIYSAGRLADVDDMAEIRSILKEQQPRGYPLRDVLKALLRSRIFLDN